MKKKKLQFFALCPGPTATGFEKAASGSELNMFKNAGDPAGTALIGYQAMMRGKELCYPGRTAKLMDLGSRISPRCIPRKIAAKMNH